MALEIGLIAMIIYFFMPNPKHYYIEEVFTKYIVSQILIDVIAQLYSIINMFKVSKVDILDDIFKDEKIKFNYLKIYKPKAIFISCADGNFPLVKVANDLNIKVIELQHGVVNDKHYAYSSIINLEQNYYPSVLLSFGGNEQFYKR